MRGCGFSELCPSREALYQRSARSKLAVVEKKLPIGKIVYDDSSLIKFESDMREMRHRFLKNRSDFSAPP